MLLGPGRSPGRDIFSLRQNRQALQFRVISIPATGDVDAEEELNRFLRSHRVVSVQKQLVLEGGTAYWCFCVEYLLGAKGTGEGAKGRSRVDYKEVLSEEDFAERGGRHTACACYFGRFPRVPAEAILDYSVARRRCCWPRPPLLARSPRVLVDDVRDSPVPVFPAD